MKKYKPKKCKMCEKEFMPMQSTTRVCSMTCALTFARKKNEEKAAKEQRLYVKTGRELLKSRSDHLRECQAVVNRYVRLRDKDLPCISCGRHHDGQYHAGHYLSVGASPELRFSVDEGNLHKQCAPCNNHLSGNIVKYRLALIEKIGLERVEWLEGPHEPLKMTIEDIIELKKKYRVKCSELIKADGGQ